MSTVPFPFRDTLMNPLSPLKTARRLFGVAGLLAVAAVSAAVAAGTEFGDYAAILGDRSVKAVRGTLPLDLQLARGERLLTQLDAQLTDRRRELAAAEIALERAELDLDRSRDHVALCATRLRETRQPTAVRLTSCGIVVPASSIRVPIPGGKAEDKQTRWLNASRDAIEVVSRRANAVAAQREAVMELRDVLVERTHRREILGSRLEELRARLAIREQTGDAAVESDDDFQEATVLFDRVEREIRLEERADELAGELATWPVEGLTLETDADVAADAEVEQVLKDADAAAGFGSR